MLIPEKFTLQTSSVFFKIALVNDVQKLGASNFGR